MNQQRQVAIKPRKRLIDSKPNQEREFMFDVKLFATIRVKARTRDEADKALRDAIECASCYAGAWPNGDPIVFEASVDGELDLIEMDGHAM